MSSFDILVTQDAENDLKNIRDYIASNISKKTSARIINIIKFNIERLSLFPQFAPVVKYEPWNSLGVRRIVVKNFLIYYRVDLEKNTVYILKVTYGKCNQQTVLEQIRIKPNKAATQSAITLITKICKTIILKKTTLKIMIQVKA